MKQQSPFKPKEIKIGSENNDANSDDSQLAKTIQQKYTK